jgi:hypothetical protein
MRDDYRGIDLDLSRDCLAVGAGYAVAQGLLHVAR